MIFKNSGGAPPMESAPVAFSSEPVMSPTSGSDQNKITNTNSRYGKQEVNGDGLVTAITLLFAFAVVLAAYLSGPENNFWMAPGAIMYMVLLLAIAIPSWPAVGDDTKLNKNLAVIIATHAGSFGHRHPYSELRLAQMYTVIGNQS